MIKSLFTPHDRRPLVMGIVNVTPDSFYAESRVADTSAALRRAEEMVRAGADILDIGGESTRPGSSAVEAAAERDRVVPVIRAIRRARDSAVAGIRISVDTRKAVVAEAALDAGATMVNDVSGLTDDAAMIPLVARRGVPVCIMHMQGSPETMQKNPTYSDPVGDILEELRRRVEAALEGGVDPTQILVDPGIGFGKTVRDNLEILRRLGEFRALGYPVLVGLSRKSFLGKILSHGGGPDPGGPDRRGLDPDGTDTPPAPAATPVSRFEAVDRAEPRPTAERLAATLAATAVAVQNGARVLRVHDVAETADLVTVMGALSQPDHTDPRITEAGPTR